MPAHYIDWFPKGTVLEVDTGLLHRGVLCVTPHTHDRKLKSPGVLAQEPPGSPGVSGVDGSPRDNGPGVRLLSI